MGEAVDRLELKLSLISAFKRKLHTGKVVNVGSYERKDLRTVAQKNRDFDSDMEDAGVPYSTPQRDMAKDLEGLAKFVSDPRRVRDSDDDAHLDTYLRRILVKAATGKAFTPQEEKDIRLYGGRYGAMGY